MAETNRNPLAAIPIGPGTKEEQSRYSIVAADQLHSYWGKYFIISLVIPASATSVVGIEIEMQGQAPQSVPVINWTAYLTA